MQRTNKELCDQRVSVEAKQFIKATLEESEKLNEEPTEAGEQQNGVTEKQLEISLEKKEPQPQQAEVIEKQTQLAEIQKQQQQDKETKLDHATISESTLNKEDIEVGEPQNKVIEEQQLEISSEKNDSQPQQTEVIEEQLPLGEAKMQQQQDKTKLSHQTRSASVLTDTIPPVDLSGHGQQVDLEELSEIPIMQVFPGLKSARKKKLSHPQKQEHNDQFQIQIQKRRLRSFNRPTLPELATDTTILESQMLSQYQDEPQQKAQHQGKEKQHQQKPPKRKREMEMDLQQPLKLQAQETFPKPRSDTDAIMEVVQPSDIQDQNEQQHQSQGQLPHGVLRSHNQQPSVSEPASLTMTLSSAPSEHQDEQQREAQHQVLGKRGRPPKPKTDVEKQPPNHLGRGRPRKLQTEVEEKPPNRLGRGRPPKLKPDADTTMEVCSTADLPHQEKQNKLPARGRGGRLKPKPKLESMNQPRLGRPPKAKGSHLEERPWRDRRGRPPKPKSDTDTVMMDTQTPQTDQVQPKRGRGRPPKSE